VGNQDVKNADKRSQLRDESTKDEEDHGTSLKVCICMNN